MRGGFNEDKTYKTQNFLVCQKPVDQYLSAGFLRYWRRDKACELMGKMKKCRRIIPYVKRGLNPPCYSSFYCLGNKINRQNYSKMSFEDSFFIPYSRKGSFLISLAGENGTYPVF